MLQSSTSKADSLAFPIRKISAGLAAMVALLLISTLLTWRVGNRILGVTESQIAVLTAAEKVEHYGLILELSIKAVVDHGDAEAATRYRSVQPRLRRILSNLRNQVQSRDNKAAALAVDRADRELIRMEYAALDLVGNGDIGRARQIIRSDRYEALVDTYMQGAEQIEQRTRRYVADARAETRTYLAIMVALSAASLALVVMGWFALIRPTRQWGEEVDRARVTAEYAAHQLQDKQNELQALNRKFFEQARRDPLTGLWTRLKFNEDIEQLWRRIERRTESFCAMMCDVDFFKQYNDTYGHLAGDMVLRRVADALDANRRGGDQLYRMGGEEFLIIVQGCRPDGAAASAEHYRAAVEALAITHSGSPLGRVTVSIGTSCFGPERSASLQEWLGEADAAMYEAKAAGRNSVVAARPALAA